MTTFVDTNVLVYLMDDNDTMHPWSVEKFADCKAKGPVIISDIVYCELSVGMASKDELDEALSEIAVERFSGSDEILFRAGIAYKEHRDKNKGPKLNVLPDFLIGASAEVMGVPLLTANPKDFLKYFPKIKVISPGTGGA